MAEEKVLDIGCGTEKRAGSVGIDYITHPNVDITHNLEEFPWPIEDNTYDLIIAKDFMEHIDNVVATMEEIHRIAKPDGILEIWTPHFAHPNSFRDPTHKKHYTFGTFDYFTGDVDYPIYSDKKYEYVEKKLIFRKKLSIGRMLAAISARRYEKYYCHLFPPHGMYFKLRIKK